MKTKFKLVSLFALIATLFFVASTQAQNPNTDSAAPAMQKSHRLIVELNSNALAVWAAGESSARSTNGHLNLNSRAAQNYMAQLQSEQRAFVSNMKAALPSATVSSYINESGAAKTAAYQVTFNGLAIDPGTANVEAARQALLKVSGVKNVYYDFAHYPSLYTSTALINAPMVWNSEAVGGRENGGRGVKFASMDGGLHKDAAMFSGVGWSYPEGWPQGGLGLSANNNGKIIASRAYFRNWDPPAAGDENPWPGVNGTEHGTHTGSTAAGNVVTATSSGFNVGQMSGVAPGAWVMSYRVFYASVEGNGSFFTAEGIAALEDIVKDGADVVNNSWGEGPTAIGGEYDPQDMALINANKAGVFVSMSAGNAGPGQGTTDHPSDDYINVAASTTSGTLASGRVNVIKPVSSTLQGLAYTGASFGAPLPIGIKISYPYVVPSTNADGCSDTLWPAGSFTGKAVLIERGGCEFGVKVLNAEQAGAAFAIVYNSVAGGEGFINMGEGAVGSQVTISSIFMQRSSGLGMIAWQTANPTAEVELDTVAFQAGNTPDQIIAFSSRGPGAGNVLKPEIAAPGVNILAQGYTPGAEGEARHLGYGQASGTSMAAPHVAGAAALLKQLYPNWSNAAIKSAMMSTSKYMEMYNFDGTPAQPLDMGAGRLDIGAAMDPGVILDPPSLSYGLVPQGSSKSITVKVTNITNAAETYAISTLFTGNGFTATTALPGFTVTPASVTIGAGETAMVEVKFDSTTGQGLGHNQGYIVMTGSSHKAHMPAWAQVTHATNLADVLIIDADLSGLSAGFPGEPFVDYLDYYTQTLTALGHSYQVWDVASADTSVPDTTTLFAYKAVILYSGDNFNAVFTQPDMDNLTHYINNGGVFMAMGQDLAAAMGADGTDAGVFLYNVSFGANWLQDSVSNNGMPNLPIVSALTAPPALQNMSLNLGNPTNYLGGATLSGANEVPPVTSTMTGQLDLSYNSENGVMDYLLKVNVTDPITLKSAHIHSGAVGVNGGVLYPLYSGDRLVTNTYSRAGSFMVSAADAAAMMAGNTYANVHTNLNPSGEIRGQVSLSANGDGAGNQLFIDEIRPLPPRTDVGDPNTPEEFEQYTGLFVYPGSNNMEGGFVAVSNRAQPSLESPGVSYWGRSILTTFGLEGVNGAASRAALVQGFLNWGMDNPTVTISNTATVTDANSELMRFEASMGSNVASATGWMYRWNFGDGSPSTAWFDTAHGSRNYPVCGTYTVWAEGKNNYGNRAIGKLQNVMVNKANCGMVGSAGGTVNGMNVKGLPVTFQVPAGVLANGDSLVYEPTTDLMHTAPNDARFAGQGFSLKLYRNGVLVEHPMFSSPITVTMGYTDDNVAGLNENLLTLRYWDGQMWSSDGIQVVSRDMANNKVVLTIAHLSDFAFVEGSVHVNTANSSILRTAIVSSNLRVHLQAWQDIAEGKIVETSTPTITVTPSPTVTVTATPSPTVTVTVTPTPTAITRIGIYLPLIIRASSATTASVQAQQAADKVMNRAAGTENYNKSVDYVVKTLKDAGYSSVTTQVFTITYFDELSPSKFEMTAPSAKVYTASDFVILDGSGAKDLTAEVQAIDVVVPAGAAPNTSTSGCEMEDFKDFKPGNIALLQRGTCFFTVKAENAAKAGAAGIILFNEGQPGRTEPLEGVSVTTVNLVGIPAFFASYRVGEEIVTMLRANQTVKLHMFADTVLETRDTYNVIAETAGGDPNHVVMVGSHLDSVKPGPGIQDNGTGSAFNLELAVQLAKLNYQPTNKIRFGWWSAEELGLLGSEHYVASLSAAELAKISVYLNFDMIASPNFYRGVYDVDPEIAPSGSTEIERVFVDYFNAQGLAWDASPDEGRSDHGPFLAAGIPAGGLFTGAEQTMTAEMKAHYPHGVVGEAFDKCYHQACDTIDNVNMVAFDEMSDAAAHVVYTFASASSLEPRSNDARSRGTYSMDNFEYRGSHYQK